MERELLEQKLVKLYLEFNVFDLKLYFNDFTKEQLQEEIKYMEKMVELKNKGQLYINIDDYQNSDFAIGRIGTLKQWREQAIEWLDSGNNEAMIKLLENHTIQDNELINYINNLWEINIVKYDDKVHYQSEYDLELEFMSY